MLKTVEAQIKDYDEKRRKFSVAVTNIDELSPEFILESIRPFISIPEYGANRRPIMEVELVPLMIHYANLHSQLGELLGIMGHRVRYYEVMGQKENGKTARTKREILEESRKDIKVLWDTIRSIAFGQQQYLRPD